MHTPRGKSALPAICTIHDLHSKVSKEKKGKVVDARCRDLTNTAAVNKARADPGSVEVCNFHEVRNFPFAWHRFITQGCNWKNMNDISDERLLSSGIWTLADILQHGRDTGTCPYFTIRRSVCSRHFNFRNENLICVSRCHLSTSSSTPSIIFWIRRWRSKFQRKCPRTRLLYSTKRIT